jgi:beta-lactamase superfamily II metal-dependent hydrolase
MSGAYTDGPWKAIAQGGSSTVVAHSKPKRNDSRIPAFGYDEDRGHCLAYPFLNDDGSARLDFVCFSHDDARLIAAAPELVEALRELWRYGVNSEAVSIEEYHCALDRTGTLLARIEGGAA